MTPVSVLLGVLAAILQLVGYVLYFRAMAARGIVPNSTSWGLWLFGAIVSLSVYGSETHDIAKLLLPAVCAVCSIGVVSYAVWKGKVLRPDATDYLTAVLDVVVLGVWFVTRPGHAGYTALLLDTTLTFIPILRTTWRRPADEDWLPWTVWTLAYGCLIVVCVVAWEGVGPALLPVLYAFLHGAVALCAARRRVFRFWLALRHHRSRWVIPRR